MIRFFGFLGAVALLAAGCGDDETGPPNHGDEHAADGGTHHDAGEHKDAANPDSDGLPASAPDVLSQYAELVHASYADSLAAANALDEAIDAFIGDPSESGLQEARDAWLAAREPYLQTEVYRFYDGPIDNADDGPEGLLNAWPLDEKYIDYVEGDADSGMINGQEELTAEALVDANEAGGEKNIATGFHAIEFLLWGQDHSDEGPGDRPYTDFEDGGTADNQERRRAYLGLVSDLLVEHLQQLVDAWAPVDQDNYRASFVALEPRDGIERILTGMIVLSGFETGGERLQTALDTGDQEDEHSCFSDNTHRDMVQDVRGVLNVYTGRYTTTDEKTLEGESLHALVEGMDADLAARVLERIETSLELAEALEPPFDQEIALDNDEGRARVEALITSLGTQEDDLTDVFTLFGLTPEIPE